VVSRPVVWRESLARLAARSSLDLGAMVGGV
jgi:hypothetical protein